MLVLALLLFPEDSAGTVSSEKLLEVMLDTIAVSIAVDLTSWAAVMRDAVNAPDVAAEDKEEVRIA